MKIRILLTFYILITSLATCLAFSNDTTFFDKTWKSTSRQNAFYYRPEPVKEGKGFRIKDYYISGKLQMTALSLQSNQDVFDGTVRWYYETGELQQETQYTAGTIKGAFVVFLKNGNKLTEGTYNEGVPWEGDFASIAPDYYLIETYSEGNPVKKSVYSTNPANLVRADVFYTGGNLSRAEYTDMAGKKFASATFNSDLEIENGQEVYFGYNPLSIYSVTEVKNGVRQSPVKYYYLSGKIKKEEFTENEETAKIISYKPDGSIWATIAYKAGVPSDGTLVTFFTDNENSEKNDIPASVDDYVNGNLEGISRHYYDNGKIKWEIRYKNNEPVETARFYKADGTLTSEGIYKKGIPYNGTFMDIYNDENCLTSYKDGVVESIQRNYPSGKLQSIQKDNRTLYFDENGKQIGSLTLKDESPYQGSELTFTNGTITGITEYKLGTITRKDMFSGNGIKTASEQHDTSGNILSEESYYSSGKLKSVTRYQNYDVESIRYFYNDGKTMGEMKYLPVKNGTEITFDEDKITKTIIYKEDKVIGGKLFREDGTLIYDINPSGKSVFYDEKGNLLSTAEYKNGEPYNGDIYIFDDYTQQIREKRSYKSGNAEGQWITYDENSEDGLKTKEVTHYASGLKNGIQETYSGGVLLKSINYTTDQPDGTARFYNNSGELISESVYMAGIPYKGTFCEYEDNILISASVYTNASLISTKYYDGNGEVTKTEAYTDGNLSEATTAGPLNTSHTLIYKEGSPFKGEIFENGTLTSYSEGVKTFEKTYTDEGILASETVYTSSDTYTETKYYENGKKKSQVSFTSDIRDGKALFYSENGKLAGDGKYENGLPVNGTFIYPHQYNTNEVLKLDVQQGKLTATFFKDNKTDLTLSATGSVNASEEDQKALISTFLNMIQQKDSYFGVETSY